MAQLTKLAYYVEARDLWFCAACNDPVSRHDNTWGCKLERLEDICLCTISRSALVEDIGLQTPEVSPNGAS